ncbi:hypothetical protein I546_1015 [Mycobacterium kansasii 732]|nr:hypothetical protein I546_1015 [Mycobacterium kansasii 732]
MRRCTAALTPEATAEMPITTKTTAEDIPIVGFQASRKRRAAA